MYSLVASRSSAIRHGIRATVSASSSSRYSTRHTHSSSTMHENDSEVLDKEKQRNLSGTQHKTSTPHRESAPGWNETLASASEAVVKADKSPSQHPEDLQAETVKYIKLRHLEENGSEKTVAYYKKDEVTGPLSGKGQETVKELLEEKMKPTISEEDVKSDRGEI